MGVCQWSGTATVMASISFDLENFAEVRFVFRRVTEHLLGLGDKLCPDFVVDIANVRNARGLAIGVQRGKVGIAAAVEPVDDEIEAVVGAKNLRIAFGRGGKGRTRNTCCEAVHESTTRNHCILQSAPNYTVTNRGLAGAQVC